MGDLGGVGGPAKDGEVGVDVTGGHLWWSGLGVPNPKLTRHAGEPTVELHRISLDAVSTNCIIGRRIDTAPGGREREGGGGWGNENGQVEIVGTNASALFHRHNVVLENLGSLR